MYLVLGPTLALSGPGRTEVLGYTHPCATALERAISSLIPTKWFLGGEERLSAVTHTHFPSSLRRALTIASG